MPGSTIGASFGALEEAEVEAWVASGSKGGNADSSSDGSSSQRADQDLSTNSRGLAEVPAPVIDSGSSRSRSSRSIAQGAGEQGHSRDGLSEDGITYSLFGYPAYDNYAGVKYPLAWVERVQAHSNATHVWKVVLDAAAFVPTHKLDLTSVPADFVPLSFYKLFGYPTGIGALIMRKENTGLLRKGYWGGGGVFLATSKLDWRYYQKPPHAFEHGTVAFTDIIALRHGLEVHGRLGGVEAVQRHVSAVGEYLYEQLAALKHSNGRPVVQVFGKHHMPSRREVQGGTVNFELLGPEGQVLSYKQAAQLMAEAGLHVRTGCCCNPGACYNATGVTEEEVQQLALRKGGDFSEWEWIDVERGGRTERRPLGSIRASLGMMTRFEDAHALVDFIGRTYVDSTDTGEVWVDQEECRNIASYLGLGLDDFLFRYTSPDPDRPGWQLLKRAEGSQDCVFLVGGTKCSIHEVWPLQCKTYPFWPGLMDPAAWVHERATVCEGISHEDAPQVNVEQAGLLLELATEQQAALQIAAAAGSRRREAEP
ncbi:hypothetical protein N2152v2_007228 [Parachlorella kessleri]